jgi:hypothetical protein
MDGAGADTGTNGVDHHYFVGSLPEIEQLGRR